METPPILNIHYLLLVLYKLEITQMLFLNCMPLTGVIGEFIDPTGTGTLLEAKESTPETPV